MDLPAKPYLAGEEGVSMSLAGVQSKLSVHLLDDGQLAIPIDGAPSGHVLKPDGRERIHGSVQNEAFCLTLARRVGATRCLGHNGVRGRAELLAGGAP